MAPRVAMAKPGQVSPLNNRVRWFDDRIDGIPSDVDESQSVQPKIESVKLPQIMPNSNYAS